MPAETRRSRWNHCRSSLCSSTSALVSRSRGSGYRGRGGDLSRRRVRILSTDTHDYAGELVASGYLHSVIYGPSTLAVAEAQVVRHRLGEPSSDCHGGDKPQVTTRFVATAYGYGVSRSPYDSAIGQRVDFSVASFVDCDLVAPEKNSKSGWNRLAELLRLAWYKTIGFVGDHPHERDRSDSARWTFENGDDGTTLRSTRAAPADGRGADDLESVRIGGTL